MRKCAILTGLPDLGGMHTEGGACMPVAYCALPSAMTCNPFGIKDNARWFFEGDFVPQSLVKLYAHVVFSTKHRAPWIVPEAQQRLHGYMTGIVKGTGARLVRIGGMPDHVHLLVLLSKTETLWDLLQATKKESSKWIKGQGAKFAEFHWQDGYAAFSVSESVVDTCIRYIDNQKKHHGRMTFQQELIMLLERNRVEYDEKYLWD